ncbi:vam6/Vps39-like protein [Leptotrombidium deliense]|uniref:Vam6/Vps39-like protein n=1 Tax=Leptotrombidium deliense TaxID=299467 RepID=A0A443SNV1_9ACAR|nr:vam6/Vps39-like protein [Leptotrombidium deliense]
MLEIYKVATILKSYPLDIECIFAYDNYLLVGTKQGQLVMYKLVPRNNEYRFEVHIMRTNKTFAKRPIVQVAAVPEFHLIISLSDNVINLHDLDHVNTPFITSISKTRGATLFVTNVSKCKTLTGEQCTLRMCVVVKKKLMLFYWKNNEFLELGELAVPDIPKVIAWCAESLYVGFKSEYSLIKVTGEQKELFPTNTEPVVISLGGFNVGSEWNDCGFAMGRDQKTFIFDKEGSPILKYPITWSGHPTCLVDDLPYLLAIMPNSVIEVRAIEPRLLLQSINDLTNISTKVKQLIKCVNKRGQLFVSSTKEVFCLIAVPFHVQVPQLLRERQFELALQLADMYEENEVDSFDTSVVSEKDKVKKDIERLLAFDNFCKKDFVGAMKLFAKLQTEPPQVIGLFSDLLPEDYRSKIVGDYPYKPPEFKGTDLENGLFALIDFLLDIRRKFTSNSDKTSSEISKSSSKSKEQQLKQIVDTTLIKCYLQTNDALVSPFLRLPDNNCHLEETERALKRCSKHNELIILYQSKGLHKRALDILRNQSSKLNFGHEKTVQYLQHLSKDNLELIFEYASWVLEEHPEDGLKIFIEETTETSEQLPRDRVLDFIQKTNADLIIPYLEHVVWNWKDPTLLFHNTLANKYREKVRVLLEEYRRSLPESESPAATGEEPGELGPLRKKLIDFLEKSDYYSTETQSFFLLNDGLWEERAIVMGKIGNHEEALTIYVRALDDTKKAEEYCNRMYSKSQPGNRDVYLTLLKLYVSMPILPSLPSEELSSEKNSGKQHIDAAIELLRKHATKIDPLRALLLLPPTTPIFLIADFLEAVTKYVVKERHEGQMFRNMLLAQHLLVQSQRIKLHQENKVIVDETDLCCVCYRKIGRSAFLRYPDKRLIHYSCKDNFT